ncbi:flagellar assembly protein FliW [Clostridium sp. AF34-13]|uniref:flagellar assembly protein FliW n=1 Tax=Clostridium sp. AF34-13 TaxID=2293012 RepID=UPI0015FA80F0|nr:flagellar assembly protein FliW [Clostridium sp. AF34-13]
MKIDTKYFGEIEIDNDKIIHFENGIMGFEEYKNFTLLYDSEAEKKPFFSWLQCVTKKSLAFPVVNPLNVIKDYNPVVEDALLEPLGELKDEDIVLLVFATIPKDVKDASVNMKAPVIVNAANGKAIQVILEKGDYKIKHKIIEDISKE